MKIRILTFDTIDSTNTEALRHARDGAEEGLCIVARSQTAGRGRYGRKWVSEKDAGLYFSMVLRPKIDVGFLPLITLMAGVAAFEALSDLGVKADIKWVNDLLADEKKIAGILAETTETRFGLAVVVGIGINIRSSNVPPELAAAATSIEDVLQGAAPEPTRKIETIELAEALAEKLARFCHVLENDRGPETIVDEWARRSSYFVGKQVRVVLESETIEGVTDGLEPNGALRLLRSDGGRSIVQTGEVQNLRRIT